MTPAPASKSKPEPSVANPGTDFDVEVFYDGECPLCVREIDMLRHRDPRRGVRNVREAPIVVDRQVRERDLCALSRPQSERASPTTA
jgi:hypothetical protein